MTSTRSPTRSAPSSVQATTVVSSLLTVQTSGCGFIDLTAEAARFIADVHARDGALTLFIRHTSASLTIQENADPSVLVDLTTVLARLAPDDEDAGWTHDTEGPDDMPAHVKASLLGSSVSIPIANGTLLLGTWQGIYLCEHRNRASGRSIVLTLHGDER